MAKNICKVLLGYEDEPISDKDKPSLNHTINKIGGLPNWPATEIAITPCPLCGQNRPLIVQIYAPLDNSQFHRTLYIFACLNGPCSSQSQSWLCVRTQALEKSPSEILSTLTPSQIVKSDTSNINWCSGVDDWGDEDACTGDTFMRVDTENIPALPPEENGNIISYEYKVSDEDEESNSIDNDILPGLGNLRVDDRNANGGGRGGAKGGLIDNLYTSKVTAEIEGLEGDVVVETPISPKRDLVALLTQPHIIPRDVKNLTLKSFYISVDDEQSAIPLVSDHVRELLQEYQKHEEVRTSPDSPVGHGAVGGANVAHVEQELYEKGVPMHGDIMFHNFMSRIQENPGQIIRYSRNAPPLLITPIETVRPLMCEHCGNELICEIQILPTLIERLRLEISDDSVPIDFGTVLVWSCIKSCWDTPDKMRTELVIVQQES